MSTVDPELRWWRNARTLRATSTVLWCATFAGSLVTGWSNARVLGGGRWVRWAGADWLVGTDGTSETVQQIARVSLIVLPLLIIVAGAVDGYARARSRTGPAWCISSAFGWAALGLGLGSFAALVGSGSLALPVLLTALGALALVIRPITRRALATRAERRAWSRIHGAPADAVATKVDVETVAGIDRWRVTLRYEDRTGRTRWHRASIRFQERVMPRIGDGYEIRYDPDHPGRRSSIHVNLARTKKAAR